MIRTGVPWPKMLSEIRYEIFGDACTSEIFIRRSKCGAWHALAFSTECFGVLTFGSDQVWKDCNTTTRAESFKCEKGILERMKM